MKLKKFNEVFKHLGEVQVIQLGNKTYLEESKVIPLMRQYDQLVKSAKKPQKETENENIEKARTDIALDMFDSLHPYTIMLMALAKHFCFLKKVHIKKDAVATIKVNKHNKLYIETDKTQLLDSPLIFPDMVTAISALDTIKSLKKEDYKSIVHDIKLFQTYHHV